MNPKSTRTRPAGSPRGHCNKKPNPTNFSNLRSQQYLNQADSENVSPNLSPAVGLHRTQQIPEQIFELSPDCCPRIAPAERISPHIILGADRPQPLKDAVSSALTPHGRAPDPHVFALSRPATGKALWSGETKCTPRSESPCQGTRRFHKLSQKVLPFGGQDVELECSIVTNSSVGEEDAPAKEKAMQAAATVRPRAKCEEGEITARGEERSQAGLMNALEGKSAVPSPTGAATTKTEFKVDLETMVNIEAAMWKMLEGLKMGTEVATHCREWWKLTAGDSFADTDVTLLVS